MRQNECYTVLRLYGVDTEKIKSTLRRVRASGCRELKLMESGGEYAIVIHCVGNTEQKARVDCIHWQNRLCDEFGDNVVGLDRQSLPDAAVESLLEAGCFAVAGSPETAELLNRLLGQEKQSEEVYDFGNSSFADTVVSHRIQRKTGEDKHRSELGYAGWQAACACREAGADLALHASEHYALLSNGKHVWAYPLPDGAGAEHRAKAMLDLARRYGKELQWPESVIEFRANAAQKQPVPIQHKPTAAQKRKKRKAILRGAAAGMMALALAAALAAAGWRLLANRAEAPDGKGYGTADFDAAAEKYLTQMQAKDDSVSAWLTLPGGDNRLVYADGGENGERAFWVSNENSEAVNRVLSLEKGAAPESDQLETVLKENAGFTLYETENTVRCKVFAVYYYDEADGFTPEQYSDLSEEDAFREFVIAMQERSLFHTGVSVDPGDSFVTLLLGADDTGAQLAAAGRVIRQGESAALVTSDITAAENPLYTAAQYEARGESAPNADTVRSVWENWYDTRNESPSDTQQEETAAEGTDPALDIDLEELDSQMQSLIKQADSTLKGLTDVAGSGSTVESQVNQGASGSIGNADMSYSDALANEESAAPTATPAPQETTDSGETGTDGGSMDGDGSGTPGEIASAEGRTINVTMNGTAQTMDLVECLAMIVQNEMGNNQPTEAYKAQAVAAHSWILSQGAYPSVSGISPSSTVRDAVAQVATVLVTYNGNVCFTPYCASVSTGTSSCRDVWGVDRAYLQAVESPYDKQYSTNWNTNGAVSGTARYSRQTVLNRVKEKLGIDLSVIEDPNDWFTILSTNAFGYVNQLQIGNDQSGSTTCSGRWFRENLLIYQSVDGRTLRSCAFTCSYDSSLDCFIFDVYGYGHGVGMSQWGAIGYAYNGWTYDQILTHYYMGTTLVSY